jgi:hypothetical protein
MPSKSLSEVNKLFREKTFQIALVGAILFLVIAHPILYDLVGRVFNFVGIDLGPTLLTVVHSIVYAVALYYAVVVILKIEA